VGHAGHQVPDLLFVPNQLDCVVSNWVVSDRVLSVHIVHGVTLVPIVSARSVSTLAIDIAERLPGTDEGVRTMPLNDRVCINSSRR
jgi:hypothetical protein